MTYFSSTKTQAGFTLLELMVTLSIAAILAAIAVPTLQTITINRHADGLANDLQIDLMYARNQALSFSKEVTIEPLSSGWAAGWTIKQDGDVIRQKGSTSNPIAKTGEITSAASKISFDKHGRHAGSTTSITIKVAKCTGNRVRTITLNPIGQLQTTSSSC